VGHNFIIVCSVISDCLLFRTASLQLIYYQISPTVFSIGKKVTLFEIDSCIRLFVIVCKEFYGIICQLLILVIKPTRYTNFANLF